MFHYDTHSKIYTLNINIYVKICIIYINILLNTVYICYNNNRIGNCCLITEPVRLVEAGY